MSQLNVSERRLILGFWYSLGAFLCGLGTILCGFEAGHKYAALFGIPQL